ncbi:uncharacterized protein LOC109721402 isoform X2 [Ananas comosus]|uniref:Uncharacterized protein LOC109721402 isoform X2 n=1 Tax=Ananas comosus TaxID=4615 RepID=A0A6P5G7N9_ANACO|nr:uncharacterized protein LOC109721402 isoform X2 [Ananas comosus]
MVIGHFGHDSTVGRDWRLLSFLSRAQRKRERERERERGSSFKGGEQGGEEAFLISLFPPTMVSTRSRAAASSAAAPAMADPENLKRRRGRPPKRTRNTSPSQTTTAAAGYERRRDERIKENLERMQKLGILDLSLSLIKSSSRSITSPANHAPSPDSYYKRTQDLSKKKKPSLPHPLPLPPPPPTRRSSRLQNVTPVSYAEIRLSKGGDVLKNSSVLIEEGSKEEVYTEEHEKLLGTCGMTWTLFVDGYAKDGARIYDHIKGKTCHQCRYGENVLEANKNPNWICPVCRGICNCSLCRVKKGWTPTGPLYKKVTSLGYKSVAHYLIQTRRAPANSGNENSAEPVSSEKLLTFTEAKASCQPENTREGDFSDFTSASVENGSNGCTDKSEILHNPDERTGASDCIASRLRSRQSKS